MQKFEEDLIQETLLKVAQKKNGISLTSKMVGLKQPPLEVDVQCSPMDTDNFNFQNELILNLEQTPQSN